MRGEFLWGGIYSAGNRKCTKQVEYSAGNRRALDWWWREKEKHIGNRRALDWWWREKEKHIGSRQAIDWRRDRRKMDKYLRELLRN